jgi:hypothetical protein
MHDGCSSQLSAQNTEDQDGSSRLSKELKRKGLSLTLSRPHLSQLKFFYASYLTKMACKGPLNCTAVDQIQASADIAGDGVGNTHLLLCDQAERGPIGSRCFPCICPSHNRRYHLCLLVGIIAGVVPHRH